MIVSLSLSEKLLNRVCFNKFSKNSCFFVSYPLERCFLPVDDKWSPNSSEN
jgi:hypothetical protein